MKRIISDKQIEQIKETPKKLVRSWKEEFLAHKYLIILSLLFLVLANWISIAASNYVDKVQTVVVPDLILDHLPVLDLSIIFTYGILIVIAAIFIYTLAFKVEITHKVASQFSLLILIRSFFIVLTHMGQPIGTAFETNLPRAYQFFNFHNDLFFSAHTAIPFMAFLLFRKEKIGIFFLVMTPIMAATVLFMHVHYSIDVFAALFITYSVYRLGEWMFKKID
jgi:hypothetical protein